MKKEKRFVVTSYEGNAFSNEATVVVDRLTGVNYLFFKSGYAGGLTPLLDRDGKPVITAITNDTIEY